MQENRLLRIIVLNTFRTIVHLQRDTVVFELQYRFHKRRYVIVNLQNRVKVASVANILEPYRRIVLSLLLL